MERMLFVLIFLLAAPAMACPGAVAASSADGAVDAVRFHLEAIEAGDYDLAAAFFSKAFSNAIKPKVRLLNTYLIGRRHASGDGDYSIEPPVRLEEDRYARVKATFAADTVYYYLIKETDAWKIEAFSDAEFDTMAGGRRLLYLWTSGDWNDTESKELKCRASIYLIQNALENFRDGKGSGFYPDRLTGSGNDPLILWQYFDGEPEYPQNFFTKRPMMQCSFSKPVPGDFTYFPVDGDGDKKHETYFLICWGDKDTKNAIFKDTRIIGLAASADERDAEQVASGFVQFAAARLNQSLLPSVIE